MMNYIEFNEKLNQNFNSSKFSAEIGETGGFLTFSNSGQRGRKFFTLSLQSLKTIFLDIKNNFSEFSLHTSYVEEEWRGLGSQYYSDDTANALCTVQTKPLFSTLSKIINLANNINEDPDSIIKLSEGNIINAIGLLQKLIAEFTPQDTRNSIEKSFTKEVFEINEFNESLRRANLSFPEFLPYRFISSLQTKPFIILTGLSGSGKTKLAEAFSLWIAESDDQYCMIAVGADWTNREPLLGFPNALEEGKYIKPDSGALDLIIRAEKYPDKPYFLILDEMNMSHVERYFADFLSAMESTDRMITLHPDTKDWNECKVPATLKLPENLFVIGTVNIDETTYMFSPKVLDRANVIEIRVSNSEMLFYFDQPKALDMESLRGSGASMGANFVAKATEKGLIAEDLKDQLMPFFEKLQEAGAEFGYRTASEISRFVAIYTELAKESDIDENDVIDAAIMQKLLPKLHGSRNKIEKILKTLGQLCLIKIEEEAFQTNTDKTDKYAVKYPLSYQKLKRMHARVIADGFTSFAEA